ncbi:MAG: hypothetical protein JHC26_11480 [Thermofilum sp.]|jgi:hypothetical protein|uniref:hypothetical protein n=1 Tax=Thermofilum sp. TaxID=1961369 RepID=UPI0025826990|nr:hypothetical protein [Thermofilum sp.]MCI4409703.1 hypothetical protein [Thermofilum sp.]
MNQPPACVDIPTLVFASILTIGTIALFQYVIYTDLKEKKRGSEVTCHDVLSYEISILKSAFKSAVIELSRAVLLLIVMVLPLIAFIASTVLSVTLAVVSLLGTAWSPLPVSAEIAISFLFLLASLAVMHYFLSKYGAIYKLAFKFVTGRDEINQMFNKRNIQKSLDDILMVLAIGSTIYFVVILILLENLVDLPTIPSKISSAIILAFLLTYVLPNKKYENAVSLIGKIWRNGSSEESKN